MPYYFRFSCIYCTTSGHILETVKKCAVVHKSKFQLRKRMSAPKCIVLTIDVKLDLLDKCALLSALYAAVEVLNEVIDVYTKVYDLHVSS